MVEQGFDSALGFGYLGLQDGVDIFPTVSHELIALDGFVQVALLFLKRSFVLGSELTAAGRNLRTTMRSSFVSWAF